MEQDNTSEFVKGFGERIAAISKKIMAEDSAIYRSESYIELITDMVKSMADDFHEKASEIDFDDDLERLTLEDGIDKFMQGTRDNTICSYLICASEKMCNHVGASYSMHGISAFCAIFFIAKNDLVKASQFVNLIMLPVMSALRIDDVPRDTGRKGGRPEHPRKAEAIRIGKAKWEQVEYASVNVVATTVKHQLDKKYTDAPSVAAIKKWLNSAGIAPKRATK
ncbi:hypothetical protein H4F64_14725 [Pectobacterium brasiliense]|uniref:hypothetical protein n=1 Tax=Pectobacterium brasiliense TaxID=180957 RepID=UPI001969A168|nr:hypothetical protein [Pectobacterium brasiliense]MBN3191453.1 hypothetical protein [Pectobacterium brasiliense]